MKKKIPKLDKSLQSKYNEQPKYTLCRQFVWRTIFFLFNFVLTSKLIVKVTPAFKHFISIPSPFKVLFHFHEIVTHLWSIESGSLKWTGSAILVKSFPMKLLMIDQMLTLWTGLFGTRVRLFIEFPFTWSASIVCRLSSILLWHEWLFPSFLVYYGDFQAPANTAKEFYWRFCGS